jgi:RNA polymerase sigma factor (sigma-70 family)
VKSHRLMAILRQAESSSHDLGSDADLLAEFVASKSDAAFATIVRRHGPMVWSVCRNLLQADADADDAFQATFLALVRGGSQIRHGERLASWLHGVALRVSMKVRKAAAKRRERESTAALHEASSPVSERTWNELLATVHEEVEQLPKALRAAFVLCCLEGVRQQDAAERLGLTLNTLTSRLSRARQRMIDGLARRGIAGGVAAGAIALGAASGMASVPASLLHHVIALPHTLDTVSPTLLQLAQGAFDMNLRTRILAAAFIVVTAMTTTVGTIVFSDATGQAPAGAPQPDTTPTPPRTERGTTDSRDSRAERSAPPPSNPRTTTEPTRLPGSTAWEYLVFQGMETANELNTLGDQGWELVTTNSKGRLVFKRQKLTTMQQWMADAVAARARGVDAPSPRTTEPNADRVSAAAPKVDAMSKTQVISLQHARANSLASTIEQLLTINLPSGGMGMPRRSSSRASIAVDDRTNSMIVITDDTTLQLISDLVKQLDVPVKGEKPLK